MGPLGLLALHTPQPRLVSVVSLQHRLYEGNRTQRNTTSHIFRTSVENRLNFGSVRLSFDGIFRVPNRTRIFTATSKCHFSAERRNSYQSKYHPISASDIVFGILKADYMLTDDVPDPIPASDQCHASVSLFALSLGVGRCPERSAFTVPNYIWKGFKYLGSGDDGAKSFGCAAVN